MGIRINKLVRASLSKIAHPPYASPEAQKAELTRVQAWNNTFLNGGVGIG